MRKRTAFRGHLAGISVCVMIAFALFLGAQGNAAFAEENDVPQNTGSVSETSTDAEVHGAGGAPEPVPALNIKGNDGSGKMKAQSILPEKYDAREYGYVTPVRDQDELGLCWSFAAISSVESSLLAHGQVASAGDLDLSERQLAYFSYNLVPEPLGNTAGDRNIPTKDCYLFNDGNGWLVTQVMASGIGVAYEKAAPTYQNLLYNWRNAGRRWSESFNNGTKLDPGLARDANFWRLSSAMRLPMKDTNGNVNDDVKQAIMANGGVMILTLLDEWLSGTSWNEEHSAYYNYAWDDCNHLVTIVGWDDNYPAANFADEYDEDAPLPDKDGAWLCKNSYGKYFGDDGYYWLSYEDYYFKESNEAAYAFEMKRASGNEILYQYDGAAGYWSNYINSGGSIANMFTVRGTSGKDEVLKSVCLTILNDVEVDYSIQIYTDCTDPSDPTSGKAALSVPQTGRTGYQGFYTIDLDEAVLLKEGSTFAVVMTLSHQNGDDVVYNVDASGTNGNWQRFVSAVSPNQSFERDYAGAPWDDLSSATSDRMDEPECAARLKAITFPEGVVETKDISDAQITVQDAVYNGKKKTPALTVTLDGEPLVKGKDFKAVYSNNLNAGTAHVTITGIGECFGQAYGSFTIKPKKITPSVQLSRTEFTYNGKVRKPVVTVRDGSRKLASSQYTVTYPKGRKNVGRYTVKLTLKRNYRGSKNVTFRINPKGTSLTGITKGKRSITVKWKKQTAKMSTSRITGYQIQYSTSKSFKSGSKSVFVKGAGKASRIIRNIKSKKTYHVRIRTYKSIGNTRNYSPWSKSRSIRVD